MLRIPKWSSLCLPSTDYLIKCITSKWLVCRFMVLRDIRRLGIGYANERLFYWILSLMHLSGMYGPHQAEMCLRACAKCTDSDLSCASAKYHPGLSLFIHSLITNDSVSGQGRPWWNCADEHERMRRLIWIFAIHICPKTRYHLTWPIFAWWSLFGHFVVELVSFFRSARRCLRCLLKAFILASYLRFNLICMLLGFFSAIFHWLN